MDETFFERILQAHKKNDKIKVLEINKKIATAKGDNFLSNIYRVAVKYSKEENGTVKDNEQISFIVKSKTEEFMFGEKMSNEIFKTEIYIFKNVLSKIEKCVGCSIGPFHYFCGENNDHIVMEDLAVKSYTIGDKLKGMSLDHCLKLIEKVAKFHAGSVAIHETEPNLLKIFDSSCHIKYLPDDYFKFLENSLVNLSSNIEKLWKEKEYQEISSKLRNLIDEIKTRVLAVYQHDADEFCVLNHGDLWINNVMVNDVEENKPYDVVLVDFQIATYTSPAIDIQHFLAMCPTLELKGEKDDYFIETYLTILANTMKKIGCKTKPPTMEQLKKAIYKRRAYSILTGLMYMPSILANKLDTDYTKVNIFDVPRAIETVHKLTKLYLHKGYLD